MQTWGAWAKRWGKSWGNSWGRIEDQANVIGGGGRASGGKYNDPLVDQVLDKWAYIEEVQKRQEPSITLTDEGDIRQAQAVPVIEDIPEQAYSGPPVSLQLPASMQAKPLPAAPKPLLPDYEMLVREAIEREDEEALILILLQL
jgi:hypothetical protein